MSKMWQERKTAQSREEPIWDPTLSVLLVWLQIYAGEKAVQLYVDGMNLRRIGRQLGVHHQSVANWTKAHAEKLPEAPVPKEVEKHRWMNFSPLLVRKKHDLHPYRS